MDITNVGGPSETINAGVQIHTYLPAQSRGMTNLPSNDHVKQHPPEVSIEYTMTIDNEDHSGRDLMPMEIGVITPAGSGPD